MKLSNKTRYIMGNILIILFSSLYLLLIKKGYEEKNIDLKHTQTHTNIVEHFGVDVYYGSKGNNSNVFYIKLKDLKEKVGVYRFSKKYDDLLKLVKVGDSVTVYYKANSDETENVNIDLIQIEKNNNILLSKSEYEKKQGFLIYIGIGGLVAHAIAIYYNRKKYFNNNKIKKIKKT